MTQGKSVCAHSLGQLLASKAPAWVVVLCLSFLIAIAVGNADQSIQIYYGEDMLPEPVREMREALIDAARSGGIEAMQIPIELNELPPDTGSKYSSDAIKHWKDASSDGTGRDILAALLDVLDAGYVRIADDGLGALYIWPYFAEIPITLLSPTQQVELYRLVPVAAVEQMRQSGRYTGYRISIGEDGVWHAFVKVD